MHRLLPILVFVILVGALLWPALMHERVLFPGDMLGKTALWDSAGDTGDAYWNALAWDTVCYYFPDRMLLGSALRSFELPLWNPHKMCGVPFLADAQTAVLYPPNILYALLPPAQAFNWLAVLHLIAAGLFTYIFLRGLNLSRAASSFGGTAFMMSGFAVVWLELPTFLSVGIWLPLALHFTRIAHHRKSIYHAAGAGIAIALSLLGGHPQIAFYCMLAVGLYWAYLTITSGRLSDIPASLALACLTFALGLALAAPQLFPSSELSAVSHRGVISPTAEGYTLYSAQAIPLWRLITIMLPDFFGNPSKGGMRVHGEYAEYCGYVGILTLMLIPLAFGAKGERRRQAWFFGGLAVLGLLMALGTGINRLFYFWVPNFANSGSPARSLFLCMFSAAVLAGFGLNRILIQVEGKRWRTVLSAVGSGLVVLVVGVILFMLTLRSRPGSITMDGWPDVLLPQTRMFATFFLAGLILMILITAGRVSHRFGGMLAIGILGANMFTFGIWYNPTCSPEKVYPDTKLTCFLQDDTQYERIMPLNDQWIHGPAPRYVMPPNLAMAYGLYDVQGYGAMWPLRYKVLMNAVGGRDSSPFETGNMVFARNPDSPVYDLLGVRWFVSRQALGQGWRELDNCYVRRNGDALPRAFIVHMIEYADDDEAIRRLIEGEVDPRVMVLAHPDAARKLDPWWKPDSDIAKKSPARRDIAVISEYTCNSVKLRVSASRQGVLVLTDQYYPGWKAFVDDEEAPVIRADYAFRGVLIPPGSHSVRFTYNPPPFERGLRFFNVALVFLAGLSIYWGVQRWSNRSKPSES